MSRKQRLHDILSTHLMPHWLEIHDESNQHHVPAGSESHFKVIMISPEFSPLNRIARHRLVNHLLKSEFTLGLHALSLHLYSPEEWSKKDAPIPLSPTCKGGSRHDAQEQKG